jgi:RNA polymerase sigma-70 factor, ECF subfamily
VREQSAQSGPAAAPPDLATLYAAEVAYVWESLRRLGAREADLEDLTHDVFLAVSRHLAEFDPSRPVRPWLFGFAFRVASEHRRRAHARHEILAAAPDRPDGGASAEDRVAATEARRLVLAALEPLSLDARAVLVLHDLDGQSIPDIAAALDERPNTLYSRLRLARQQFVAEVRRLREQGARP